MTLTKSRIEVSNDVFSLPYHVAKEEGYFEQEGCDVELVPADIMQLARDDFYLPRFRYVSLRPYTREEYGHDGMCVRGSQ